MLYEVYVSLVTSVAFIVARALLLQRKSMLCTGYQCRVRVALFWQSALFLGQGSMWFITTSPEHEYSSELCLYILYDAILIIFKMKLFQSELVFMM